MLGFFCKNAIKTRTLCGTIVFLEQTTNRLKMVQTSGNTCDEGEALGFVVQSKVKLKLAPLGRYSRESAENFLWRQRRLQRVKHGLNTIL